MTSKNHKYTLLNVQNEDSEIDLQFQDFEQNPSGNSNSKESYSQNQAVFFNSFTETGDDDQEQKLLDSDERGGTSRSVHSFWTFEYYQQFFDVESKQVGDRIIWSMIPKPGVNFLKSYIRPNPDLYGPFWICVTLVFTTAIAGNLSNYLQSKESDRWKYDFHLVTLATSCIFTYAMFVPILIWGVLLWRSSKSNLTLLELICLYGYSLAIFVPVSLLWMIPLLWLKWCLGIVASVLSGSVLVRTIQPALSHEEPKKIAYSLAVFVLVLHAVLALGFMLYFFYPPSSTSVNVTPANSNYSTLNPVEDAKVKDVKHAAEKEDQKGMEKKTEEKHHETESKDKKQERSENIESSDGEINNSEKLAPLKNKGQIVETNEQLTNDDQEGGKLKEMLSEEDKNKGKFIPLPMSLIKDNDTSKITNLKISEKETINKGDNLTVINKNSSDEKSVKISVKKLSNGTSEVNHTSQLGETFHRKRSLIITGFQDKSIK